VLISPSLPLGLTHPHTRPAAVKELKALTHLRLLKPHTRAFAVLAGIKKLDAYDDAEVRVSVERCKREDRCRRVKLADTAQMTFYL